MGRIDLDEVRQHEYFFLKHLTHFSSMFFRFLAAAEKVGARNVANQKCSSGKQQCRLIAARAIRNQQAYVLGGMARCLQDFEHHLAHLYSCSIR